MNFWRAGYEIIDIPCLVGFKEADDPYAQRCSNLQADETGNNNDFPFGECPHQISRCGNLRQHRRVTSRHCTRHEDGILST